MRKYGKDYPTLGSLARTPKSCCAKKNEKIKALNTHILFVMVGLADNARYTYTDAMNNAKQAFASDDPAYIVVIAFAGYLRAEEKHLSEAKDKVYLMLKKYHDK